MDAASSRSDVHKDSAIVERSGSMEAPAATSMNSSRLLAELKGPESSVNSAEFSPDERRIVTASSDKTVRLWGFSPEIRTNEQLAKLIRCHVPAQFEREGSSLIVFRMPIPTPSRSPTITDLGA